MKRSIALLLSAMIFAIPVSALAETSTSSTAHPSDPPAVIPALREWNDANVGWFSVNGAHIVNTANSPAAEKISSFFKEMCGLEVPVAEDNAKSATIELIISDYLSERIDDEGYTLEITENEITVTARTDIGLLYGGITLVQMCYADGEPNYIRCGSAVDYPKYKVRSGMIDVGRVWVPLDYVEEITKYMAWFKLNEIHLHINDCNSTVNTGFRLESDVPGLSSVKGGEIQYYTKDDYRSYQKRMLEYGVSVVTEIDTPSHSAVFANVTEGGPHMLYGSGWQLDIRDEYRDDTLEFVKNLFAEYLTGDDPVIINNVVHIGTDEYDRTFSEEMRKYTADLAEYIHSLGYTPRYWGGSGPEGFPGETEIPKYLQCNFWDNSISGLEQVVEEGRDIINTLNALLYVVPTGNGFPDYLDLEYVYNVWQVNKFNGWGYEKSVDPDYEHLLGACFALWNDLGYQNLGITQYDIFDRIRGMACLVAEKTWDGNDTANIPTENFLKRYELLSKFAGSADPGYHAYADNGVTFSESGEKSADIALNGNITDGKFILDGNSYISSDFSSAGFPATFDITLCLDELPTEPLFNSETSAIYADADGRGRVGFKIDKYTFTYDYSIPLGVETRLTFVCDGKSTLLVVNGNFENGAITSGFAYDPINNLNLEGKLANLVVPLAKIGKGARGYIKNLSVVPYAVDTTYLSINRDLAYGRPVTVSGLEVNDGRLTPDLAVDGNPDTRLSLARDKDEQWLVTDLGAEYDIRTIIIDFYEHVSSYDIFLSIDGKDYKKVYGITDGETRVKATDTIELTEAVPARYVKYVQNKRNYIADWDAYYSGGISGFSVYSYDASQYRALVNRAFDKIIELGRGDERSSKLRDTANKLEIYISAKNIYKSNIESMTTELQTLLDDIDSAGESNAPEPAPSESEQTGEGSSFPIGALVPIAAAVVAGLTAVIVALRKKKKK